MTQAKRSSNASGDDRKKKKYRASDGTPVWGKRSIEGPGIWVSYVKGKEKQAVGELYDLFDSLVPQLWPTDNAIDGLHSDPEDSSSETSIEAQVAKEISVMKRPKAERLITNCLTNTPCVIFMSCKPPVDPVRLVISHMNNVQETGVTRTRYAHRFIPVSATCVTNIPEIQALCHKVFSPFFSQSPDRKFSYKIDLRVRNHTTVSRPNLIDCVAQCVPEGHTVDLTDPEVFILVEVFKSVCGISIVRDYYKLQKFNVTEIANARNAEAVLENPGRVSRVCEDGEDPSIVVPTITP